MMGMKMMIKLIKTSPALCFLSFADCNALQLSAETRWIILAIIIIIILGLSWDYLGNPWRWFIISTKSSFGIWSNNNRDEQINHLSWNGWFWRCGRSPLCPCTTLWTSRSSFVPLKKVEFCNMVMMKKDVHTNGWMLKLRCWGRKFSTSQVWVKRFLLLLPVLELFASKNYLVGQVEKSISQCATHHCLFLLQVKC